MIGSGSKVRYRLISGERGEGEVVKRNPGYNNMWFVTKENGQTVSMFTTSFEEITP